MKWVGTLRSSGRALVESRSNKLFTTLCRASTIIIVSLLDPIGQTSTVLNREVDWVLKELRQGYSERERWVHRQRRSHWHWVPYCLYMLFLLVFLNVFACLNVYLCTVCMQCWGWKMESNPLGLELQMLMKCHVSSKELRSSRQPPSLYILMCVVLLWPHGRCYCVHCLLFFLFPDSFPAITILYHLVFKCLAVLHFLKLWSECITCSLIASACDFISVIHHIQPFVGL